MKTFLPRLIIALIGLLTLANCAQNPVTGQQNFVLMSEDEEVRTGRQGDTEVRQEYGVYNRPELQRYVDRIGQRLAAHSHRSGLGYHFTVVDSPEINAFALPGGYVYITRGILAYLNSEAEMAAVIGHEIGHVTARHSVQQYSAAMAANIGITLGSLLVPELRNQIAQSLLNTLGGALLSGYGREHELEADRLGAEYLARAGYDPQAMVRVIKVLKNQEMFDAELARQEGREPRRYHGLFATHPDNDTRLKQVVGEASHLAAAKPEEGRAAFYSQINGMVFGDSPEQGMVRGNTFLHEGLGIALDFPAQWKINNRADRVQALAPRGEAGMEMVQLDKPDLAPADFLGRALKLDAGGAIETFGINGMPAAMATGRRQGKPITAGIVYLGNKAFALTGGAGSAEQFSRNVGAMQAAIRSFRSLNAADRKLARPYVMRTITARTGTTMASLARNSPLGKNAESQLRLMNNLYPTGEPQIGQALKIIE